MVLMQILFTPISSTQDSQHTEIDIRQLLEVSYSFFLSGDDFFFLIFFTEPSSPLCNLHNKKVIQTHYSFKKVAQRLA